MNKINKIEQEIDGTSRAIEYWERQKQFSQEKSLINGFKDAEAKVTHYEKLKENLEKTIIALD